MLSHTTPTEKPIRKARLYSLPSRGAGNCTTLVLAKECTTRQKEWTFVYPLNSPMKVRFVFEVSPRDNRVWRRVAHS